MGAPNCLLFANAMLGLLKQVLGPNYAFHKETWTAPQEVTIMITRKSLNAAMKAVDIPPDVVRLSFYDADDYSNSEIHISFHEHSSQWRHGDDPNYHQYHNIDPKSFGIDLDGDIANPDCNPQILVDEIIKNVNRITWPPTKERWAELTRSD